MSNGLVYIGKVTNIFPIEGADRIESLEVFCDKGGRWRGTAQKGQFQMGDLAQVYLQDSLLPQTPVFAFMEKHKYRVRMMRLKGTPSEVLVMPLVVSGDIGDDITEVSGVTKYEKPLPLNIGGDVLGNFPSFIPKTDETNFQSVPEMIELLSGQQFYSTVKADGSSATVYKLDGHFGCCSRNLELKETPNNAIWQIARRYDLERMMGSGTAIQFEVVGPGIQGNPMGLKIVEPRLFNVYLIHAKVYLGAERLFTFSKYARFPAVDIVDFDKTFNFKTDEDLRLYAQGIYPNGRQREGIVIRPIVEQYIGGTRVSFKILNLLYKES